MSTKLGELGRSLDKKEEKTNKQQQKSEYQMLRQKIQQDAKIISFKVNNLKLELEYIAAPKDSNLASCQLFTLTQWKP